MESNNTRDYEFFISHATEDKDVAEKLASLLKARNHKTFIATQDTKIGDELPKKIAKALLSSEVFIAIVSTHTEGASYQGSEIKKALELYKNGQIQKIIPINLPGANHIQYQSGIEIIKHYPLTDDSELDELAVIIANRSTAPSLDAKDYLPFSGHILDGDQITQPIQPILRSMLQHLRSSNDDADFFGVVGILDSTGQNVKVLCLSKTETADTVGYLDSYIGQSVKRHTCAMGKVIERALQIQSPDRANDIRNRFDFVGESGFSLSISELPSTTRKANYTEVLKGTKMVLGFPIFYPGNPNRIIGTMNIDTTRKSQEEIKNLRLLTNTKNLIAHILTNQLSYWMEPFSYSDNNNDMKIAAMLDTAQPVWRRAFLLRYLKRTFSDFRNNEIKLPVLRLMFFNINRFYKFNIIQSENEEFYEDRKGGDKALHELASWISNELSELTEDYDFQVHTNIFYYSADEFCILFESKSNAVNSKIDCVNYINKFVDDFCDRFRNALEGESAPLVASSSCTAGIAEFDGKVTGDANFRPRDYAYSLISSAANCMWKAKKSADESPYTGLLVSKSNWTC